MSYRNTRYNRNYRGTRNGQNERNERNNRPKYTREEQYERNYQYIIRNITENLRRGSYRNISTLQKDLEALQNNQFCQSYEYRDNNNYENNRDNDEDKEHDNNGKLTKSSDNNRNNNRDNNKEDVFLPLNKILKYNKTNEKREPQTITQSKRQFSSISKTQSIQIKSTDDIIHKFKAYSHIDLSKTGEKDEFVFCLLFQLSNLYKLLSGRERREYRSQLYRTIVAEYDSKELYKKYGYKERKLNRNGMKSSMMRQAPLDLLGQILIMDYFKINVLIYKPDKKKFFTYIQYNEKYANIFMRYQHNKYTPMEMEMEMEMGMKTTDDTKNEGVGEGEDENEVFYSINSLESLIHDGTIELNEDTSVNPFTNRKLKVFSAYKLPELREIAEELSIELTKFIGNKEKKKTKRELYDEITQLYEV